MKKRFLCFLLMMIMLVTLCPTVSAYADQSALITEIKVTGVQTPMAGESTDTSGLKVTTEYGDVLTIVRAYWYNNTTNSETDTKFKVGNEYKLCVVVSPQEGYEYLYDRYKIFDGTATFNGEEAAYAFATNNNPKTLYLESTEFTAKTVTITEIEVTGMQTPTAGASTDTGDLKATTEHGDVLTIPRAYWYNNDTASSTDKVFKKGNEYKLCVTVFPQEKYDFLYDKYRIFGGAATFNGDEAAYAFSSGDISGGLYLESPPYTAEAFLGTSDIIAEIKVTGMQTPIAGASTDTSGIKVTTDQGDVVVLDRAYWYNNDTASETDATFTDGDEYKLCVGIYLKAGYAFLYDRYKIFDGTATFNGVKAAYAFASGENQTGMYLESPAFTAGGKKTPTAADFVFTPPADPVYNGSEKPVIVAPAAGVTGMGNITVKYSSDGFVYDSIPPKNAGTYKVAIDVSEGAAYTAAIRITSDAWTFKIVRADPSHTYGTPSYTWTGDSCTAERTCILCSEGREGHKDTETATVSYVKDTEATCAAAETGHYRAVFTNTAFSEQNTAANSVTRGNPKGHTYPDTWEQYDAEQHSRVCTECGEEAEYEAHSFSGNTCTVCGYVRDSGYLITCGANGMWTKGDSDGLPFTSNAPFDKFDSVEVDGAVIPQSSYTAAEGSTKVLLLPAYLETLTTGEHSIEIVSADGSASTGFTVKAEQGEEDPATPTDPGNDPDNRNNDPNSKKDPGVNNSGENAPATGDSGCMDVFFAVMLISLGMVLLIRQQSRKENRRQ